MKILISKKLFRSLVTIGSYGFSGFRLGSLFSFLGTVLGTIGGVIVGAVLVACDYIIGYDNRKKNNIKRKQNKAIKSLNKKKASIEKEVLKELDVQCFSKIDKELTDAMKNLKADKYSLINIRTRFETTIQNITTIKNDIKI